MPFGLTVLMVIASAVFALYIGDTCIDWSTDGKSKVRRPILALSSFLQSCCILYIAQPTPNMIGRYIVAGVLAIQMLILAFLMVRKFVYDMIRLIHILKQKDTPKKPTEKSKSPDSVKDIAPNHLLHLIDFTIETREEKP